LRAVGAGGRLQVLQVADRADVVEPVVLEQRDARGVVAAVLEALQSRKQQRLRLAGSDVSDDPAHLRLFSSEIPVKTRKARPLRAFPAAGRLSRALDERARRS